MSAGNNDGEFNPTNITVFGNKVALKKIEVFHDRITPEGIIIPESVDAALRLNRANIIAIGKEAHDETGLNVGDLVLYDSYAVFHDSHPVVVLKYDSIIWKLSENNKHLTLDIIQPVSKQIIFKTVVAQDIQDKMALIVIPDSIKAKATAFGEVLKWSSECSIAKYFDEGYKHIILTVGAITRVHTSGFTAETILEDDVLGIF